MSKPRINWTMENGTWVAGPPKNTSNEFDQLFSKLDEAVNSTLCIIEPILKAGGAAKPQDRAALRQVVFTTMLEKLHGLSKDELHAALTSIFADRIMQDVEDRPYGGPTPDLLSGK